MTRHKNILYINTRGHFVLVLRWNYEFVRKWNDFLKNEGCHAVVTNTDIHCAK